jgi:hypothetical protein
MADISNRNVLKTASVDAGNVASWLPKNLKLTRTTKTR